MGSITKLTDLNQELITCLLDLMTDNKEQTRQILTGQREQTDRIISCIESHYRSTEAPIEEELQVRHDEYLDDSDTILIAENNTGNTDM